MISEKSGGVPLWLALDGVQQASMPSAAETMRRMGVLMPILACLT
jgi:hypothetical protein